MTVIAQCHLLFGSGCIDDWPIMGHGQWCRCAYDWHSRPLCKLYLLFRLPSACMTSRMGPLVEKPAVLLALQRLT